MRLAPLATVVAQTPALRQVLATTPGAEPTHLVGPAALRPFLVAGLAAHHNLVVAVTATTREAQDLADELAALLSPAEVALYPTWETLPHERLSPRADTMGQRIAVLRQLVHPEPGRQLRVVVAPVRAVLQPQVAGLADLEPVQLHTGQEISRDELVGGLAAAAYQRVDLVEKRGQFAVRGGIVDVFPPTEDHPIRIEFFGDEIDELRAFSVADQRTLDARDHLWAPPCGELLLTDAVRARAAELSRTHPELADITDRLAEGIAVEGMESLAPVLVDQLELLIELVPTGTQVVSFDHERIRARAEDLVATSAEFLHASWAHAAAGGEAPIDVDAASLRDLDEVVQTAQERGCSWWTLGPFGADVDAHHIPAEPITPYRGDIEAVVTDVRQQLGRGGSVVIVQSAEGSAQRTISVLKDHDIPARLHPADEPLQLGGAVVEVMVGLLHQGFSLPDPGLTVLTAEDISGQKSSTKDMRAMPSRRRARIDPLELKPGDFVVHEQHGVGQFLEMRQREVQGAMREYLVLEYGASKRGHPPDRLYVPADALDQVTRYVGGENPTLDRLGGADWAKRKGRARKAVKEIAAELIKLYAARQATQGHAFGPDSPWQRELEDAFPFQETPDQLVVVDEVKADMERVVPMDRLICGDVGYGKTEIAVRAAFKAVQDGKQVAVLVPTTLLVNQHLSTFTERMGSFPLSLAPLSRFQTEKEANATIAGLADGSVDIVIGTHRLLNPGITFKDLGLIIVDEEQRFGVEHKELMKRLRTSVDVLSMSATPIPRTLEMAVTGIREMSTIMTPPEERHPVLTFVGAYEERQVVAAIRRELLRDGQVFFIHNRVSSIDRAAARLQELVPEARIATAHGQMGEARLEQVMVDFWEREFDVLVCTTIVESGLDVSNANTMIIDRADMFGLSQLHQLRGRVGRGRSRAYAYFLYPPDKPLTETAHERLATLAQHSDLGGGMAIAMKDLEIRGAGNLLGGEQSGHIANVGFDLYVRLVGEAVTAFRNDGAGLDEVPEVRIELPVDAHLPHDYIPSERLRLEIYKRLSEVTNDADVAELAAELADRYGPAPDQVARLLAVARFRARARQAGLTDISIQGKHVRFTPVTLPDSRQVRLKRLYPKSLLKTPVSTLLVPRPKPPTIGAPPLRDEELLAWVHQVVDVIIDPDHAPPSKASENSQ